MQNRRQHYRHFFSPNHRLRATVIKQAEGTNLAGEIVNLSLGGVCVKLDSSSETVDGMCHVKFVLDGTDETLHVRAERIHAQQPDRFLGLKFHFPIHLPTRDSLERKISKYLLDVQRFERQRLREAKKAT